MLNLRIIVSISLILLIINLNFLYYTSIVLSQSQNKDSYNNNRTNTWISKQNNLNITMNLQPSIPIIDQKTKISFEIKKIDNSSLYENLNAKATITDQDGRLFKFNNQPVLNGKFSIEYIFPDAGHHTIILQLYKNGSAFAIGSFTIVVPPAPPPDNFLAQLFKYRPF